ncbi:uncharacterized protein DUF4391 [Litorimonas taeanensis]|uniref:Uncharacterized protein DUF4391 n=1 Tax=Litorimonas taeanensis TaxID=568099 RepID=A0A420WFE5_9PROT|nr:DUF4391 domain-containing protein [Litorimonas taeanensis]RKQ69718.1 uncharacterized protein DUF4391 [Litorimonas taeanensis]
MSALFAYPKRAKFDRMVSKTKLFSYEKATPRIRDLFSDQVEQVRWIYKLAPETINLMASKNVPEIQIFNLRLKGEELDDDVLRHIDKAIAFPIIFELAYGDNRKAVASPKWQGGKPGKHYYASNWVAEQSERQVLPVATNLEGLYSQLLQSLMPYKGRDYEGLFELNARIEEIRSLEKRCESLRSKIGKEKQFNRRVEFNRELKKTSEHLSELIHG